MADVEEVSAEIAGQKLSLKSVALNTLTTVATLIGVIVICMFLWQHQQETKEAGAAFVSALKEQTIAYKEGTATQREQNCLLKFKQEERQQNADFCRQISGVDRPR